MKSIRKVAIRILSLASAFLLPFFFCTLSSKSATFTVINTNDSGSGSLRQAIQDANNTTALDTITFAIPGAGVQTITLTSGLSINQPVVIDGWSQGGAGYTGPPLIELNGNNSGGDGFTILAPNCTVRGLIINRFSGNGINIQNSSSSNNLIVGNYIGTNQTGTAALPNGQNGIQLLGAANNTIGGLTASERNVISGNGQNGVLIQNSSATGNVVVGNYIGTNAAGTAALGNGTNGVRIDAPSETIGGGAEGARNVISGNLQVAVLMINSGSVNNRVQGNYIGIDATGASAVPNQFGVVVGDNVTLKGVGNSFVGTDGNGVNDATEGNVISGNLQDGVTLLQGGTTNNRVAGNRIGTNAAGTAAVPNGGNGVLVERAAGGNFIGTNNDGVSDPLESNVISGNTLNGVLITDGGTDNNKVAGNLIGTNASGTAALSNGNHGVLITGVASTNTIGGTTAVQRNIISGNLQQGVRVSNNSTKGNLVQGNFIGTGASGATALPNSAGGVTILGGATGNSIGGTAAGEGNTIAFNTGAGVTITDDATISNQILSNSIFSNTALGIDLGANGVTPNDVGDGDTGPNNLQNFPVITIAVPAGVQGTLNSTANTTFRIEIFASAVADPSGFGEGQTFVGTVNATTNGSGNATFTLVTPLTLGQFITATATTPNPSTSEFSQAVAVVPPSTTAVDFVAAVATRYPMGVVVEWRTGFEIENLGFNVYREVNGERTLVTRQPVAGSALFAGAGAALTAGKPYRYIDKAAPANATYWIEDLDLKGSSSLFGPFFAEVAPDSTPPGDGGEKTDSNRPSRLLEDLQAAQPDEATLITEGPPDALAATSRQFRRMTKAAPNSEPSWLVSRPGVDPAGQPALKLAVSRDGWYRASPSSLLANGKGDLAKLQLFNQGVEIPIRIAPDGMIEFYGQGLDTPSTDQRTYWLVVGSNAGQRIPQSSAGPTSQVGPASFTYTVERRDRTLYFSALLNGEIENIFGPLIGSNSATSQNLIIKAVDTSQPASLEVTVQGVTDSSHTVRVSLAGVQLGTIQFTGRVNRKAVFSVSGAALVEGNNEIALQSVNGSTDINLADRVRLTYSRFYRADSNQLRFGIHANQSARINGFTDSQIKVFDITDPLRVSELLVESVALGPGDFAISIPPTVKPRTMLAIAGATAGEQPLSTLNQPSNLKDRTHQADLVIITHRDFQTAVAPLAAHRRAQGLRVEVVDIEDVYDEFGFANHTPSAVREFLNWTKTQWSRAPRFALLVGDSTWDPRNYLGLGRVDFVPTKLIDTALMETASDDWLADFNGDGLPEIALGRLPVRTAAHCETVINKLIVTDGAIDPQRGALFVADNGFEGMNAELRALLPGNLPVQTINRSSGSDPQVRAQILAALNGGPRLVNFTGHGSVTVWTGAGLLTAADGAALTNTNRLPLMLMLTCLNGYSHDASVQSLGEAMLLAPNGASAVWTSTGMTEPEFQRLMAVRLFQQLSGASGRIGELMLQAKSATSDRDVRRTWILLGDPSMQFRLKPD